MGDGPLVSMPDLDQSRPGYKLDISQHVTRNSNMHLEGINLNEENGENVLEIEEAKSEPRPRSVNVSELNSDNFGVQNEIDSLER